MQEAPLELVKLEDCEKRYYRRLLRRSEGEVVGVTPLVEKLVDEVRLRGDLALVDYTKRFDRVQLTPEQLPVSKDDIKAAYKKVDSEVLNALRKAAEAIKDFHKRQRPREWSKTVKRGIKVGQIIRPLASAGVYAPGGTARYPSTILMTVIPAKAAGVKRVIVCTPPGPDGEVDPVMLAAAGIAGANEVYRVGGAQAIAAMAYGTRTIKKVDKIVGPGNIYVAAAKQLVMQDVDIDFEAGPSEVLILTDSSGKAEQIAVDMMAQAEHDALSAAVLVTTSDKLAENVREEIRKTIDKEPRARLIAKSLKVYGRIIIARSMDEAIDFVNDYAPEHLQIIVRKESEILKKIRNAGAIFIGPYTPVAVGDFATGPSHVLPTGGVARRRSGLSTADFLRMPSIQRLTRSGLKRLSKIAETLAEVEGLPAHARSIRARMEEEK